MFQPLSPRMRKLLPCLLRYLRGADTQNDFAELCGIGVKSYSSWECGTRINGIRVADLDKICAARDYTLPEALMIELPDPQPANAFEWEQFVFPTPREPLFKRRIVTDEELDRRALAMGVR